MFIGLIIWSPHVCAGLLSSTTILPVRFSHEVVVLTNRCVNMQDGEFSHFVVEKVLGNNAVVLCAVDAF